MKLLDDIRNEAVEGNSSLTVLLRKCQILAAELQNADFKQWVSCELNGYPNVEALPKYRIIKVASVGNFAGSFGRTLNHAPIPFGNLKPNEAEILSKSRFVDGVGAIESLLSKEKVDGQLSEWWPTDFIGSCAGQFYRDFNLIQAFKVIPRSAVAGILEAIRNRVLEFVLEIQREFPNGLDEGSGAEKKSESVQQIFNTYILGDGNRVATGCGAAEQNMVNFEKGNWAYLEGILKQLKVAQDDISELKGILKIDPPESRSKLGDRLNGWLGGIAAKAAQAGYDIPIGIGLAAILKFCGLN